MGLEIFSGHQNHQAEIGAGAAQEVFGAGDAVEPVGDFAFVFDK